MLLLAGHAEGKPLVVSTEGVGGIRETTPFDQKELARLLPGLKLAAGTRSTEGEEYPVIRVLEKKRELAVITPSVDRKRIYSIIIGGARASNALGPKHGDSYSQVYGDGPGNCAAGMEELSGKVICPDPGSRRVQYVFEGEDGGPDGQLPQPDVLSKWRITHIVWTPL